VTLTLRAEKLAVARGGFALFEDLSFKLEPGAHAALTGPNGAGKTSLLRVLAGLLRPLAGALVLEGVEAEDRALHVHLLAHRDGLKGNLDARAHLRFWRDLLGGAGDVEHALQRVGLGRIADLPARTFSAGQSRRLSLARLLIAPRPIWLLDEPSASLDAAGKLLLQDLIAQHRAQGGLVIAATHEPLGDPSDAIALSGCA
jgi:heme exporter protein A